MKNSCPTPHKKDLLRTYGEPKHHDERCEPYKYPVDEKNSEEVPPALSKKFFVSRSNNREGRRKVLSFNKYPFTALLPFADNIPDVRGKDLFLLQGHDKLVPLLSRYEDEKTARCLGIVHQDPYDVRNVL